MEQTIIKINSDACKPDFFASRPREAHGSGEVGYPREAGGSGEAGYPREAYGSGEVGYPREAGGSREANGTGETRGALAARVDWLMVAVYSAAHFLVDFACAFFIFRRVAGAPNSHLCVLLYNFCAFAAQMPIGLIADKLDRNSLVAAAGAILAAASYALAPAPAAAVFAIGIGNAMFHIGGGIDVLNASDKKFGALGVFVSPGAFGIYYGTMLGKGGLLSEYAVPPALAAMAALILATHIIQKRSGRYVHNAELSLSWDGIGSNSDTGSNSGADPANSANPGTGGGRALIAACLFAVVCLRSFAGLLVNFPWKGAGSWGAALICAVVFGKTLGGFFAGLLGARRAAALSLGAAAFLFLLPQIPLAGVLAVLLFNMTMPVTLWAMAKLFPGAKGFAFGLLTFGLFLGFLPVYLGAGAQAVSPRPHSPWLFASVSAASLAALLFSLKRAKL